MIAMGVLAMRLASLDRQAQWRLATELSAWVQNVSTSLAYPCLGLPGLRCLFVFLGGLGLLLPVPCAPPHPPPSRIGARARTSPKSG